MWLSLIVCYLLLAGTKQYILQQDMEKTTRDMYISKAYVFKKSIGFFVVLVVLLLYFGQRVSYGMGSRGGSGKKTTIIRGIVYDKSKPAWQGSIAGAKIRLLDVNGGFFKEVSSNARGYYEINLKLYSGRYKLVCAADNFKPAEIIRDITKGRAYDTGFDFYLEPIDTTPRNPAPEKPVTPPEPEPEPPIVEPKPDPAPVAPVIPPEPEKPACQTIGPEGGQVVSDDGKVKVTVIISLGALSEPKTISVLKVSTDNLQTAAPSGSSLLSVVECKPYGLVFNRLKDESGKDKPAVELIYDLCYEMVAGTKVE